MCVVFAADRLTTSRRRGDGPRKGKDVMTFRHFFTFFLGIVLALTLVPAAQAANLFIDDSVEAEITLAHDANWEFGVLSNGTPFPPLAGGSTTAPGEVATFSGSWIVNSPGNPDPGTGIIYFVDQAAKAAKKAAKKAGKKGRILASVVKIVAVVTGVFVSATSSRPIGAPSGAQRPSPSRSFQAHVAGTWVRCLDTSPASEFPTRPAPLKSVGCSVIWTRPPLSQSPLI